jgi:AraC-like DNA-binding protein
MRHNISPLPLSSEHQLRTLVENRTTYALEQCELNVFETHQASFSVPLTFNQLVVTSMLRGKKVMHLFDDAGFDYLPGESVIVPADVTMRIDFPEANGENPTQCTALAIDSNHINGTLNYLNEYFPKESDQGLWQLNFNQYHYYNNEEIALLTNKLISICTSSKTNKDIFADLTLKELLVSIMQNQHLNHIASCTDELGTRNPLAAVIGYIRKNVHERFHIEQLSNQACMSKATFYRAFKRELGISPLEFIFIEKINRAKELLKNHSLKIAAISDELGFSDANYFIRVFKKLEGITPHQFRLNYQLSNT